MPQESVRIALPVLCALGFPRDTGKANQAQGLVGQGCRLPGADRSCLGPGCRLPGADRPGLDPGCRLPGADRPGLEPGCRLPGADRSILCPPSPNISWFNSARSRHVRPVCPSPNNISWLNSGCQLSLSEAGRRRLEGWKDNDGQTNVMALSASNSLRNAQGRSVIYSSPQGADISPRHSTSPTVAQYILV